MSRGRVDLARFDSHQDLRGAPFGHQVVVLRQLILRLLDDLAALVLHATVGKFRVSVVDRMPF